MSDPLFDAVSEFLSDLDTALLMAATSGSRSDERMHAGRVMQAAQRITNWYAEDYSAYASTLPCETCGWPMSSEQRKRDKTCDRCRRSPEHYAKANRDAVVLAFDSETCDRLVVQADRYHLDVEDMIIADTLDALERREDPLAPPPRPQDAGPDSDKEDQGSGDHGDEDQGAH